MKVDGVVIARDSTDKSCWCAFVTVRCQEFHLYNPGFKHFKDLAVQVSARRVMVETPYQHYESVCGPCGHQIYGEVAHSQRCS